MKLKVIFVISILAAFVVGILFSSEVVDKSPLLQKYRSEKFNSSPSGTNLINMASHATDETLVFFSAQVRAPSDYYATLDAMLDPYDTQGGMAPPRLILMKGHQVLGTENYFDEVTKNSKDDCIVIWSTKYMEGIESWNGLVGFEGELVNKRQISVGERTADIYNLQRKVGENYVGILEIGDSNGTSYFFHTCNTNNESDFLSVISSMKFRGDVNYN